MNDSKAGQRTTLEFRVNERREEFIRTKARDLLHRFHHGSELSLPVNPKILAEKLLSVSFEEVEEIGDAMGANSLRVTIAAMVEARQRKVIYAARGFSGETRRFTLAHEVGHVVLHPGLTLLRESPRTDSEIRSPLRTVREREADIFASELLMPSEIVQKLFSRMFGPVIDRSRLTDDHAFLLSEGKKPASHFTHMGREDFAKTIATASSFVLRESRCLSEIFRVSPIAMAIQLLDLQLVQ
jgi:hypothetical protein